MQNGATSCQRWPGAPEREMQGGFDERGGAVANSSEAL